jgi:hypothetical protein
MNTMRVPMREGSYEIPMLSGSAGSDKKKVDQAGFLGVNGAGWFNKWGIITVSLQAVNKSREVWGDDASVFRRALPSLYRCTETNTWI